MTATKVERTNVSYQLGYRAAVYQELEARIRTLTTEELRQQSIDALINPRVAHTLMNEFRLAVAIDELYCRVLEAGAKA